MDCGRVRTRVLPGPMSRLSRGQVNSEFLGLKDKLTGNRNVLPELEF